MVLLLGFLFAQPQDVLQAVEGHLDDLGVHHREQIAQRLDAAQVHQISKVQTPNNSRLTRKWAGGGCKDKSTIEFDEKENYPNLK